MTKVQIRFRLEKPLDDEMMGWIAGAHSIYGIMRVEPKEPDQEILVSYDASRLRQADVGAILKRGGIPVVLE